MKSEATTPYLATMFAVTKLAEARDEETGEHLDRVRRYAKSLAQSLVSDDTEFVDMMYHASPLHDVGKVAIPDGVLCKPGKLTDQEFEVMKSHTTLGADAIASVREEFADDRFVQMVYEIVRWHHEKWDGSGYPDQISGDKIPLPARIIAVVDVYDALTSRRCYKEAFSHEDSKAIMVQGAGQHFEPAVVDAFFSIEAEILEIADNFPD